MTKKPIAIGSYSVGGTNECFIIAEMGSNHDGKISRAKKKGPKALSPPRGDESISALCLSASPGRIKGRVII